MFAVTRYYEIGECDRNMANSVEIEIDDAHSILIERGTEVPRETRIIVHTRDADAECVWSMFHEEGVEK